MSSLQSQSSTITSQKENEHWTSFRSAVSSIQSNLIRQMDSQLSDPDPTNEKFQTETPRFDFSDLDKINASQYNHISDLISPLHEDTNVSQSAASRIASEALSMAEQQLAKMKLQLALTEAERDELEFELMQSSKNNDVGAI